MECHLCLLTCFFPIWVIEHIEQKSMNTSVSFRIEQGVRKGSILGLLLFNIDLIDLLYDCEEDNIANYADDTTPYSCAMDIQTVISEL